MHDCDVDLVVQESYSGNLHNIECLIIISRHHLRRHCQGFRWKHVTTWRRRHGTALSTCLIDQKGSSAVEGIVGSYVNVAPRSNSVLYLCFNLSPRIYIHKQALSVQSWGEVTAHTSQQRPHLSLGLVLDQNAMLCRHPDGPQDLYNTMSSADLRFVG